ncbi:MAG: hypothetical protein MN733_39020 [Nitrososphaera sp.]|nr:hypothetical protein [Nitrososphaera sp.]
MFAAINIVILIGATCGLIMVCGSIWLLRLGVIDLREKISESGGKDALNIALKEMKFSTRYPALGLFVIGLIFVLGSAYFARQNVREIPVSGEISAIDDAYLSSVRVRLLLQENEFPVNQAGSAEYVLLYTDEPKNLMAQIIAPGYADHGRTIPLKQNVDGSWSLNFSLGNVVAHKPVDNLKIWAD